MALNQLTVQLNDLNLVIDNKVLENLYAYTVTPADINYGVVNSDYQGSAYGVSTVGINVFNRVGINKRILNNSTNGGFINTDAPKLTTNRTLALNLLNLIDPIIQIPDTQQGMLNYSIVENISYNVGEEVRESVDIDTLEEIYNAGITFGSTLTEPYSNVMKFDLANKGEGFSALQKAKNYLTNFSQHTTDKLNDTTTPTIGRVQVVTELLYNDYISDKGIVVSGSDLGLITMVNGVEGYTNSRPIQNTAWKGIIFGINTYVAPDSFFPEATTGSVYGIVTHPTATTRAFNAYESKIVDATAFMGMLWQGRYQYGVLTTRPHMVSVLASADWTE